MPNIPTPLAAFLSALALSMSLAAHANQMPPLEQFKLDTRHCQPDMAPDPHDRVVASTRTHLVLRQDAGNSCAAGSFFLLDRRERSFRHVEAGTCDDRNFSVTLGPSQLTFRQGGRITALYPIY